MTSLKCKFQAIWLVGKQIWYMPFIWSLAWYSYWIFHSAIVLKTPFYEGNTLNYVGAAISVAALLIAGYHARQPIRQSVGKATHSLFRKPIHATQTENTKKPKPDLKQAPPIEMKQAQKEISPTKKLVQKTTTVNSFSISHDNQPALRKASRDFSSECLTCPSLINCTYRQKEQSN